MLDEGRADVRGRVGKRRLHSGNLRFDGFIVAPGAANFGEGNKAVGAQFRRAVYLRAPLDSRPMDMVMESPVDRRRDALPHRRRAWALW